MTKTAQPGMAVPLKPQGFPMKHAGRCRGRLLRRAVWELLGRLEVGGAVAEQAGGGNGLGEDDTDGYEDGAGAGSERNRNFHASAFGILIAAAEGDAAFGKIFANRNFFLEAAAADAGQHAGLDAGTVAAGDQSVIAGGLAGRGLGRMQLRLGFNPNRWSITDLANAGDTFAGLERPQVEFIEVDH